MRPGRREHGRARSARWIAWLTLACAAAGSYACRRRPALPALEGPPVVVRERDALGGPAPDESEREPNDRPAQAHPIAFAPGERVVQGVLGRDAGDDAAAGKPDVDHFLVRAQDAPGEAPVLDAGSPPSGAGAGPLWLLDVLLELEAALPEGVVLALEATLGDGVAQTALARSDDGAGPVVTGLTSLGLRPGTAPRLTLRLRAGVARVPYRLRVVRRPDPGTEEVEPNDAPATATALRFEAATAEVSGRIALRGDSDHFAIAPDWLSSVGALEVEVELPPGLSAGLALLGSAGQTLASVPPARGRVRLLAATPPAADGAGAAALIVAVKGGRQRDAVAPYLLRVRPGVAAGAGP